MQYLIALAVFVLAGLFHEDVHAQADVSASYPNKPVRWVVAVAPGGFNDILARIFSVKLTDAWGQQFVIDNRAGAGGLIGAETVAKGTPDGYTLLLANAGPSINVPLLKKNAPYKVDEFTPIVYLGYAPLIIVTHPSIPAKNPAELLSYLKGNPGKVNWGSSGNGSPLHIGLALFQAATGVNVTHVAYKGAAQALTDAGGGQIQVMHATTVSASGQIKAGRVKIVGVASEKRSPVWPDVPTLAESGIKNAEAVAWVGMSAPPKTPRSIVNKLNAECNRILLMPDVKQRLDQLSLEPAGGTPEQFVAFIKSEAERFNMLVKAGTLVRE